MSFWLELISSNHTETNCNSIKKAYRRKALELHPDRNYGDAERTAKLFVEVQSAYEVLSDPQERAWYDTHEDAILHDMDGAGATGADDDAKGRYEQKVGLTTADDIARMVRKFHGNVEYSDASSGFFGFLRDVFDKLAKEERLAAQKDGDNTGDYPSFGHKEDDYEDVVKPFYAAWAGFATAKSFGWRDRYRTADAEDRRMRRLMEKENKKFRGEAIQEFNEAVRSLLAFVRRRDPRYRPNTQSEAERQQVLRDVARAQAARMRAANSATLNQEVAEWAKTRESDELLEESEEESEEEQFECVACKKTFKSEKQFEAHERSKKHIKAVQALRKKLKRDGQSVESDRRNDIDDDDAPEDLIAEKETDEKHTAFDRQETQNPQPEHETSDSASTQVVEDDIAATTAQIHLKESRTWSKPANTDESESSVEEDDGGKLLNPNSVDQLLDSDPGLCLGSAPRLGKAAQKRAKKAAKQPTPNQEGPTSKCAVCYASFPSRTRLFQHVKDFGHAALMPNPSKGSKGKRR